MVAERAERKVYHVVTAGLIICMKVMADGVTEFPILSFKEK